MPSRHSSRLSLLGAFGGLNPTQGYQAMADSSRPSLLYIPNTKWTISYCAVMGIQAAVILALEAFVFARFQDDLIGNGRHEVQARTIPTFLALFIFGLIYELILAYDALRLKNTIQIIGLAMCNVGLLIYGAVQMEQIAKAVLFLDNRVEPEINPDVWWQIKPYLIAIPCLLAVGTIFMAWISWELYNEFAWSIYKNVSADVRMKRRYLIYQIYIALLKFDFFFFVGFTIQFLVIVRAKVDGEFGVTIAAIPVTILILLGAVVATRSENFIGMIVTIVLYLCGLAYFVFKLTRVYTPGYEAYYKPARRSFTFFAVITIILILCTILNAGWCTHNFGKGLKEHVAIRWLSRGKQAKDTELTGPNDGVQARMVID